MDKLYLSPSKAACYDACPYQYYLKYVLRVSTISTSINLVFGKAVHTGIESYALSLTDGVPADPVAAFEEDFAKQTLDVDVAYGASWCKYPELGTPEENILKSGRKLMELLPEAWSKYNLLPILDNTGAPMVERDLVVDLGNGVILRTKLDLGLMNHRAESGIVDAKTPAQAMAMQEENTAFDAFMQLSDQMTDYQIAWDAHAPLLELEPIRWLGYWEFVKRPQAKSSSAKGSYIADMKFTRRRTPQEVAARVQKLHWMAEDIRRGRFPKKPGMPHSTPCALCDYSKLCSQGLREGLVFKNPDNNNIFPAASRPSPKEIPAELEAQPF